MKKKELKKCLKKLMVEQVLKCQEDNILSYMRNLSKKQLQISENYIQRKAEGQGHVLSLQ